MRTLAIWASAISGAAVGLVLGVLVGTATPNSVIPAGVIPLVLLLAGAVGFPLVVSRTWPRRQDGNARAVKRSSASP